MLLIPEIETVVILVPVLGTSSLIKALTDRYKGAMRIYRHMEADGVPDGYEHWRKVGVVRDPLARLWSLYKYLKTFDGPYPAEYIAEQRASVDKPFDEWLLNNTLPFTQPYDSSGRGRIFPGYNIRHNLPETRKSQYVYLRPDLWTNITQFSGDYTQGAGLKYFGESLRVSLPHLNKSEGDTDLPRISSDIVTHMLKWFAWDLDTTQPDWCSPNTLRLAQKAALSYGNKASQT